MVELRPYQRDAANAIVTAFNAGDRAVLLVMATGTGKTTVFGEVVSRAVAAGKRVLVLAHRDELIRQAAARIESMTGIAPGIEKAAERYDGSSPVCVGSIQTMQGDRLTSMDRDMFGLIVVDEAHHSVARTYKTLLMYFSSAKVLGVTATADRADRRGLAEVYDRIAYEYGIVTAVEDGNLVPIVAKCLPLKLDISDVAVSHGDWQVTGIATALDPYLDRIAETMAAECAGKRTVAFLPLVDTSEKLAAALVAHGMRAASVSGRDTDENRRAKVAAFASGELDVICNAMLLTEGWDCPEVDCIVVLRPTRSRSLYTQMVGRGTRPAPGKSELLLLDFLWMTDRHDLCRPASLIGMEPAVVEKVNAMETECDGAPFDVMEAVVAAESEVAREREERLAAELEKQRRRKSRLVNPLQFAASIASPELMEYVPTFAWEAERPTTDQIDMLDEYGVDGQAIATRGQAEALIDELVVRSRRKLATPRQIRLLERYGFRHVGTWHVSDASMMISRISGHGWTVPRDVNPATYAPREKRVAS